MTTMTRTEPYRKAALDVIEKKAVFFAAADDYRNAKESAPTTPTGRISKKGKMDIAAANAKREAALKDFEDAKAALADVLHKNALFWAPKTRDETLQKLGGLFGDKLVTAEWKTFSDAYRASRKIDDGDTGYTKGNIVVLDVTGDNPAFKNVRSHVGYGKDAHDEFADHHAHLWFWIGETGHVTRARLYAGAKSEFSPEYPSSYPLDDHFGIDLERGENSMSISTHNGTTSEVRAWAAKISLAADALDKLQPLFLAARKAEPDRYDMADVAADILAG